jgi:parallel beta-helix repeat protein/predicted outer membrane repeat protein
MRFFIIHLIFLSSFLPFAHTQAKIIHIPADSSTIQAGINGAVGGDTVLVARGHYYERINFLGKAILVASNFIFDDDTATIDSTIIDADTLVLGISDTGSVVVFVSGEDSNSVIEGFTLQNGIGTLSDGDRSGGGIYSFATSPTICNNTVTNNSATAGGGIYCAHLSSPTISNNIIDSNFATHWGGGICCRDIFLPTISNNTITGNSAGFEGGGLYCELFYFASAICNNVITGNSAGFYGGGISCFHLSSSTICNNTISGNSADHSGGGIACLDSRPIISYNTIIGNFVTEYGGGIFCLLFHSPTINNNTISYNSAGGRGGGICCSDFSSPAITNNIISNSLDGEGISYEEETYPTIYHNDVWNNADGNFYDCPAGVGDTTWGANFNDTPCDSFYNVIRDPLFADTIDFEPLCNSPCIDAGDPSIYVPPDSGGCRIDMGAREYPYILGDANSNSSINIADIVFAVNYLFINGPPVCPHHTADTNCDGLVDIEDIICLAEYLFLGGPLPCS